MAHRGGRRSDRQPSLLGHCGRGLIFIGQRFVANDPYVWSGRASQEVSSICRLAVLRQCIRPLVGAFCVPGHHGCQRTCDPISGQASNSQMGHQCSHVSGRPILDLIFSSRRPRPQIDCGTTSSLASFFVQFRRGWALRHACASHHRGAIGRVVVRYIDERPQRMLESFLTLAPSKG